MLTAVVTGLLCGNRGYKAIAEWLHDLPVDVWHWMGYTRTPPKQDCFRDLLKKLDPESLEEALTTWIVERLGLEIPGEDPAGVSIAVKENQPTLLREITLELVANGAAFSPLHSARAQ